MRGSLFKKTVIFLLVVLFLLLIWPNLSQKRLFWDYRGHLYFIDLFVIDNHAYVEILSTKSTGIKFCSAGYGDSYPDQGCLIFDLSDPANPEYSNSSIYSGFQPDNEHPFGNFHSSDLFYGGDWYQLICEANQPVQLSKFVRDDLHNWNLDKSIELPVVLGAASGYRTRLAISAEYAYILLNSKLYIVNLSESEKSNVVNDLDIEMDGSIIASDNYLCVTGNPPGSADEQIRTDLYNISIPSNPEFQSSRFFSLYPNPLHIKDGHYISRNSKNLCSSDIEGLKDSSTIANVGDLSDFIFDDNRAYLVADQDYVHIVDISDVQNMQLMSTIVNSKDNSKFIHIAVSENLLLIGRTVSRSRKSKEKVDIYDITNPENPSLITTLNINKYYEKYLRENPPNEKDYR